MWSFKMMAARLDTRSLAELADQLTTCRDRVERDALVEELATVKNATVVSFLNAHACNLAAQSPAFHETLMGADYLLRDGAGVELHMLLRGCEAGVNLNGTDLIPDLVKAIGTRKTIALYGTRPRYVNQAADVLRRRGMNVLALDGYRPDSHYLQHALDMKPTLIVLGMGMPKQELLSARLKQAVGDSPTLIVNGGAIIDYLAGRYARAPQPMRRMRLESLYRLAREPRRLWRRNVGSVVFVCRSLVAVVKDRGDKR